MSLPITAALVTIAEKHEEHVSTYAQRIKIRWSAAHLSRRNTAACNDMINLKDIIPTTEDQIQKDKHLTSLDVRRN